MKASIELPMWMRAKEVKERIGLSKQRLEEFVDAGLGAPGDEPDEIVSDLSASQRCEKRHESAVAVVEMFARRWTIEQLFSVAKNQMGFDSAEVRKERSVKRHAALCMALITWAEVWAHNLRRRLRGKPFAAKLSALREEAAKQLIFASGPRAKGSGRIASCIAQLFSTATTAA